jgi:hypothetical protein
LFKVRIDVGNFQEVSVIRQSEPLVNPTGTLTVTMRVYAITIKRVTTYDKDGAYSDSDVLAFDRDWQIFHD